MDVHYHKFVVIIVRVAHGAAARGKNVLIAQVDTITRTMGPHKRNNVIANAQHPTSPVQRHLVRAAGITMMGQTNAR